MHLGDEQITCWNRATKRSISLRIFFICLFFFFWIRGNFFIFFVLSFEHSHCFSRGIMMMIICSEFWLIEFYNLLLILNAPAILSKSWIFSWYQFHGKFNLHFLYYYSESKCVFLSSLWFKGWLIIYIIFFFKRRNVAMMRNSRLFSLKRWSNLSIIRLWGSYDLFFKHFWATISMSQFFLFIFILIRIILIHNICWTVVSCMILVVMCLLCPKVYTHIYRKKLNIYNIFYK